MITIEYLVIFFEQFKENFTSDEDSIEISKLAKKFFILAKFLMKIFLKITQVLPLKIKKFMNL